jgi:multidrug resistance protein, MATE family
VAGALACFSENTDDARRRSCFFSFIQALSLMVAGVAIGAGWQSLVAFVNIGCYYLVGLPLAAVFGFLASAKRNSLISYVVSGDLGRAVIC